MATLAVTKDGAQISIFLLNQLSEFISVFPAQEAGTQHVSTFMIGEPRSA